MPTPQFPVAFDNPIYSALGVALAAVLVILFYLSFKRLRIAQKRLEPVEWRSLRRLVRLMNMSTKAGAVIALSLLLARPYFPTVIEVPVDQATQEQIDQYTITTLLLMDVSYSMNYSDFRPTRLEYCKTMIKLLIDKMNSTDSVGFISFAGQIYDTVFPTTNRQQVIEKIDNQTSHPSTSIGTALSTAIGVLQTYPPGARAIVLFSDGKSNAGGPVVSAAVEAAAQKIPIFTISVGTYSVGEADPIALRDISSRTGGKFYEARNENVQSISLAVAQISREVKAGALEAFVDKLVIPAKDYQTPTVVLSAVLVATLLLTWFTGV